MLKLVKFFKAISILLTSIGFCLTSTYLACWPMFNYLFIIFRYDDHSVESDRYIEEELTLICENYNFPISFATIPFGFGSNVTIEMVEFVKKEIERGRVEITQHGFSHCSVYIENISHYSEFYGKSMRTQHEMIRQGKRELETKFGVIINTFVPPHNCYDKTTLAVLEQLDFKVISAMPARSFENESTEFPKLQFVHARRVLEKESIIETVKDSRYLAPLTNDILTIYFHDYNFKESYNCREDYTITLKEFDDLCHWISEQPDVKVILFNDIISV